MTMVLLADILEIFIYLFLFPLIDCLFNESPKNRTKVEKLISRRKSAIHTLEKERKNPSRSIMK